MLCVPALQANEVEQALWRSVFYKPIEEFRNRIKVSNQTQAQAAAQQGQLGGAAAAAGAGAGGGGMVAPPDVAALKAQFQKLTTAYLK